MQYLLTCWGHALFRFSNFVPQVQCDVATLSACTWVRHQRRAVCQTLHLVTVGASIAYCYCSSYSASGFVKFDSMLVSDAQRTCSQYYITLQVSVTHYILDGSSGTNIWYNSWGLYAGDLAIW